MPDSLSEASGEQEICEVMISAEPCSRGRYYFAARIGDELLFDDEINPCRHDARRRFVRELINRLRHRAIERREEEVESLLRDAVTAASLTPCNNDIDATNSFAAIVIPGPDFGVYRSGDSERIANFIPRITSEVTIHDDGELRREFHGHVQTRTKSTSWCISADDYASDSKLKASLYAAAGANLTINCKADELRNAVATLSAPRQESRTTDFGWTNEGTFLVPGAVISVAGWHQAVPGEMTVNLDGEDIAHQVRLQEPIPAEVERLKRDVVPQLLQLANLRVMLPLIGILWLPVLHRFLNDARPFCLWLAGETGAGKSYVARLMQKFYGNFAKTMTWASTMNSLQREGYFFRNALALIDDYKPEITHSRDVTKLIQSYADGAARGRLKKDATSNPSREFRGWMLSTGEDLPEHSPSTLARTIIVRVPRQEPNLFAGRICQAESVHFPQLTAAFIHSVITQSRGHRFAQHVDQFELDLQGQLQGRQNQGRICRNFAILLAATWQSLEFLIEDVAERNRLWQLMWQFAGEMIHDVVCESVEQAPHEVMLANLRAMLASGRIQIEGINNSAWHSFNGDNRGASICRVSRQNRNLIEINMTEAFGMVNRSLHDQSKQELKISHRALLDAFRQAGLLLTPDGRPLPADSPPTSSASFQTDQGRRTLRVIHIHRSLLVSDDDQSRPHIGPPTMCGFT